MERQVQRAHDSVANRPLPGFGGECAEGQQTGEQETHAGRVAEQRGATERDRHTGKQKEQVGAHESEREPGVAPAGQVRRSGGEASRGIQHGAGHPEERGQRNEECADRARQDAEQDGAREGAGSNEPASGQHVHARDGGFAGHHGVDVDEEPLRDREQPRERDRHVTPALPPCLPPARQQDRQHERGQHDDGESRGSERGHRLAVIDGPTDRTGSAGPGWTSGSASAGDMPLDKSVITNNNGAGAVVNRLVR